MQRQVVGDVEIVLADPVLTKHHPATLYKPGGWGTKAADAFIAADGGWHNPILVKEKK